MLAEKDIKYLYWIAAHVVLGGLIYLLPIVAKIYGVLIFLFGIIYVFKTRNKNHEALFVSAYAVGSEVLLRMTDGNPVYEFSKYAVILFLLMAMYFKGFSRNAVAYWVFLVLLVPGVLISTQVIDFDESLRKSISFNISGPVCLGISALYMYNRKISFEAINDLLALMAMPIITTAVYLIFYTPNIRDVVTGTSSNFETSGGFGPNQVSTMLGMGIFILFVRLVLFSKSKLVLAVNLVVFLGVTYRGLVTFSRGGIMTAIIMILVFLVVVYIKLNNRGRIKLNILIVIFLMILGGLWSYSSVETGGMIEKRYANQDASGRVKESQLSGREDIMKSDLVMFAQNPFFGVGVAKSARIRGDMFGMGKLSHNELTRMLAEHGAMGIMSMLILIVTPLVLYIDNRSNLFVFCFLVFWALTISHAAMRLAAPAFIYALSILKVYRDEENPLHRQQTD
ncbi:O-antigen ligase like membrane protein [Flavobacterium caeni]|uniref:O-antigen ligase like membrane protein n=2 Tax=Flavobacterium caeni TaxID=490189 RepID=A0A1G5FLK2_9FLAO|nr:O-antigen ligase like membrane protein [Flavobacterium caeni]